MSFLYGKQGSGIVRLRIPIVIIRGLRYYIRYN